MNDCIPWIGYIGPSGYGQAWHGPASRHVWELEVGPIPEGLEIDHLCRNRSCVNVEHLEVVTHAENMRRSRRPFCRRGLHEMTDANIYSKSGRRACLECRREKSRQFHWANREKRLQQMREYYEARHR